MFDKGSGPAIVVIPGVQGRWEWMRPALEALTKHGRVISYSLGDAKTFQDLVAELDAVIDAAGVGTAALCGISFGGRVAAAYAAARPSKVMSLVIASTPGPSFAPSERQARYLSSPWLSTPAFLATSPGRMWPEVAAAIPDVSARLRFAVIHTARILAAPIVPAAMATRMSLPMTVDLAEACRHLKVPTLVVTGEPALDRVVPTESTREFVSLIPGAKYEMIERTGHIGLVTQPDRFARIVGTFVHAASS